MLPFLQTTTGLNKSPSLHKHQLSTSVGAHTDDIIVLGGLDEEQVINDSDGLSFLLSWLRSKGLNKSKKK